MESCLYLLFFTTQGRESRYSVSVSVSVSADYIESRKYLFYSIISFWYNRDPLILIGNILLYCRPDLPLGAPPGTQTLQYDRRRWNLTTLHVSSSESKHV
jgi:hypothetical protein